MRWRIPIVLTAALLAAAACSDSSDDSGNAATTVAAITTPLTSSPPPTTPATPATTTTEVAATSATAAPTTTTGAAPTTTAAPNAPGEVWDTVDATTAGFDPSALDQLAADAEAAGSTCTAIVRDGKLVDERDFGSTPADEPREVFSVTKSITSVLVGIAADQGLLSVDDPVATYVPEWAGTPSATVTVGNLLSNDSGRHWDANTDYVQMAAGADDKTAFAIALGQDAPPGEVWAYNNSAIQVLSQVLEVATGETPVTFADRVLFQPIGMTHSMMTTDAAGNATTYAGLRTTCSDLARFGWLMEQRGLWNGEQIVSAQYVDDATGESSTPLNAAYGWLFWLNQRGPIASPSVATAAGDSSIAEGQFVAGQAQDIFWALGLYDQVVAVIPDQDVVAVRLGARPDGVSFNVVDVTSGVLGAMVSGD